MKSCPAEANGIVVFTVISNWSVAVQPLAVFVAVSVYVVVAVGLAVGFDTVDEVKPVTGDQL